MVIAFQNGIVISDGPNTSWEIDQNVNELWNQFYKKLGLFSCKSFKTFVWNNFWIKLLEITCLIEKIINWPNQDGLTTFFRYLNPFYVSKIAAC